MVENGGECHTNKERVCSGSNDGRSGAGLRKSE